MEVAFLNFAVDFHGQKAGLQTFSVCELVACPLAPDKQVNLTVSMTPPELPEKLVSVLCVCALSVDDILWLGAKGLVRLFVRSVKLTVTL